jgi:hypothetical protein
LSPIIFAFRERVKGNGFYLLVQVDPVTMDDISQGEGLHLDPTEVEFTDVSLGPLAALDEAFHDVGITFSLQWWYGCFFSFQNDIFSRNKLPKVLPPAICCQLAIHFIRELNHCRANSNLEL